MSVHNNLISEGLVITEEVIRKRENMRVRKLGAAHFESVMHHAGYPSEDDSFLKRIIQSITDGENLQLNSDTLKLDSYLLAVIKAIDTCCIFNEGHLVIDVESYLKPMYRNYEAPRRYTLSEFLEMKDFFTKYEVN